MLSVFTPLLLAVAKFNANIFFNGLLLWSLA